MILKKYITLWLSLQLFQLLVEINCQMIPKQRLLHTTTLINNKLYILGGIELNSFGKISGVDGKEFFYLDVSAPFDTQKLLWKDLTSINIVPEHYGAASVKSGADNSTLFLY